MYDKLIKNRLCISFFLFNYTLQHNTHTYIFKLTLKNYLINESSRGTDTQCLVKSLCNVEFELTVGTSFCTGLKKNKKIPFKYIKGKSVTPTLFAKFQVALQGSNSEMPWNFIEFPYKGTIIFTKKEN